MVVGAAAVDVGLRGEHHPARAEAALGGVVVRERLLHDAEAPGRAEALDGRDLGAVDGRDGRQARAPRAAVDEHGAGAAAALLAAGLRARDPELLAQHVEQRGERARSRSRASRPLTVRFMTPPGGRRGRGGRARAGSSRGTRPTRARRRASATSASAASPAAVRVGGGRLGRGQARARAGDAGGGEAHRAVGGAGARDGERRVLVGVRPVERVEGARRRARRRRRRGGAGPR